MVSEPKIQVLGSFVTEQTFAASATTGSSNHVTEQTSSLFNQNKTSSLMTTLNQFCSIKLDQTNYLLWSSMVLPVIRGNKLDGFILGT